MIKGSAKHAWQAFRYRLGTNCFLTWLIFPARLDPSIVVFVAQTKLGFSRFKSVDCKNEVAH